MRRVVASLIILLYPVWSHTVIAAGHPGLSLPGLAALIFATVAVRDGRFPRSPIPLSICIGLLAAGVYDLVSAVALAVYLPPILLPAFLAWVFGRTLLPGRTPLVMLFVERVMHSHEPERQGYMRGLTWFWTLLCAALAVQAALLALFADPITWSLFANGINYAIVVAAFMGEYLVRCIRFGLPDRPARFWLRLLQTDFRSLG